MLKPNFLIILPVFSTYKSYYSRSIACFMNKYLLLIILVISGFVARSQCLTNSLVINTGYNPITGTAIAGGANGATPVVDPHWILSAVSPGVATAIAATPIPGLIEVVPGNKANVIQAITGSWAANPAGQPGGWISCLNSNTYNDCICGTPYNMTLGRPFRMCADDSITFRFYIANDNYISASNIDGTPLSFSQPGIASTSYFSAFTFFTQTVFLTAGTHTVNFVVNNFNITTGTSPSNPTGLDIYGTISSTSGLNSLVYEGSASCNTFVCGGACNELTMPDSLHLCEGATAVLDATITGGDTVLSMTWSPATGLSSTTILNPTLTASSSGWYDLTVQSLIPYNLVANGDFSAGNSGFSSSYIWSPPPSTILNEGYYSVYNNPNGVHTGFLSMTSYPVTGGNMLIINGGSTASSVWCESIPVTPNTTYDFSAWFADCSSVTTGAFVPVLQFMVNGVLLGVPTPISAPPGTWVNFFSTWYSGANTTATICIYDETTAASGNDFVIDDISFEQICTVKDSTYVKITVPDTTTSHSDTSICALAGAITLHAPTGYTSYIWNTGATSPSLLVPVGGTYWVSMPGTCALQVDTFHVNAIAPDTLFMSSDSAFCIHTSITLNAPGGAGLSSPLWSTGSVSPSITVTDTGVFWVDQATACGGVVDTFDVTYKPQIMVTASSTVKGCDFLINFFSTPTGAQYNYYWLGPAGFNSNTQDPVIAGGTPADQGVYSVTVVDNATGCSGSAATNVIIPSPPLLELTNITPTQTINYGGSVQLNVDGAMYYWWIPDNGTLNNPNINNPVASPTQNTTYTVYGKDSTGWIDSVNIQVDVLTDSIVIPSAFTPNNDGLNDIFRPIGMKYQSMVEFSVYNRWGQKIFTTNNKNVGWDGTFNGVPADMDVYNYVLIVSLDNGTLRSFKGNVTLIR